MLPIPSEEQLNIVAAVGTGNVIVDSVAGSGKTTTILHIAKTYFDKKILLFTYNSKLRHETRDRCDILGIENITVHTYHSYGHTHISTKCKTDQGLIESKGKKIKKCPQYDIFIIDEAQDMTPLYYDLSRRSIKTSPNAVLCIIGDKYQSIYGYADADARFITLADILHPNVHPWERLSLNTSYRITIPMADFINNCVIRCDGNNPRITAIKPGKLPKYTICRNIAPICDEIRELLKTYKPNDIFILAASVKSGSEKNPIKMLANMLTHYNIPIYVPNDNTALDDEILQHKVVFSSFHQAKGLERKVVIVCDFSDLYFKFFGRGLDPMICPNTIYVAITRATEHLSIYQSGRPFKFIDIEKVKKYTEFKELDKYLNEERNIDQKRISVTKLVAHIPSEVLAQCMKCFDHVIVRPADDLILIKNKSEQVINGQVYHEDVSNINGIVIPARYEYLTTGSMTIQNYSKNTTAVATTCVSGLLKCANIYESEVSALRYKIKQIVVYNWINNTILNSAVTRLSKELMHDINKKFEVPTKCNVLGYDISGRMDIISDERILEIKTVNELSIEHYIQLAVYAYCDMITTTDEVVHKKYHLYNIRDNALIEISSTKDRLYKMIKMILCNKYHFIKPISDKQFLARARGENVEYQCNTCRDLGY